MGSTKTAISIDESLFRQAEELARDLGVSRSSLFARAMEEFLSRHDARETRRRLDEVHGRAGEEDDRRFVAASRAALADLTRDDEW